MSKTKTGGRWQIHIDTGGTFTDCIGIDPSGNIHRAKVLSTGALRGQIKCCKDKRRIVISQHWGVGSDFVIGFKFAVLGEDENCDSVIANFNAASSVIELETDLPASTIDGAAFEIRSDEEAPILATRIVTQTNYGSPLPQLDMKLASTRGTNALLQRQGSPLALFITTGFKDLLLIGDQQRPDLFALDIEKPKTLYEAVYEVDERLAADGSVLRTLKLDSVLEKAKCALEQGMKSAAIALMHSYINPEHEQKLARELYRLGFTHVSCSSDMQAQIKLLPRCETAVADAYLGPVIEDYLERVALSIGNNSLLVMSSAGGLVKSDNYRAKDSLLSGPAGGVIGAVAAGQRSSCKKLITFDMGGTSTDVSRFDGDYEYDFQHQVAGVKLVAPALAIETVAAGGGSICEFVNGQLMVGPNSAGSDPGPACYVAGGPLTITDVNLLLGRLDPDRFEIPISIKKAEAALQLVRNDICEFTNKKPQREELLQGFLDIANERMAEAICEVSLSRGYDPSEYTLVAFGGAGGQHACAIANILGIKNIIMPADASLLSAVGLSCAVIERFAHKQILKSLDEVRTQLPYLFEQLQAQALSELKSEVVDDSKIKIRRRIINLRLLGQESSIAVVCEDIADLQSDFQSQYKAIYGHVPVGKPIEVESIRVVASTHPREIAKHPLSMKSSKVTTKRKMLAWFDSDCRDIDVFERAELSQGVKVIGPAIIFEQSSTYVIESGWTARVDENGALILSQTQTSAKKKTKNQFSAAREALFANRFTSIAKQMGQSLTRTALSTNVKERLDFSCALLDRDGYLVVHAPHMPVHLGALGLCARALAKEIDIKPGDVVITNHPAFGGSHLPDITVVTGAFYDNQLIGYAVSRAHHAELGGIRPGSMAPDANSLAEEAVVIRPMHLLRNGKSCFDDIEKLLSDSVYPSRMVDDNLADLRAAVAANQRGVQRLCELADVYGYSAIIEQMQIIRSKAELLARKAISQIPDGRYEAKQSLDDGSPLCVVIEVKGDEAVIDFAGTAQVHPGNLNATPAIVHSAVIYVLRVLIGEALPLNEGIMQAIKLKIPKGMLNPDFDSDPHKAPAVSGGNVETSQRIVEVLFKALNTCAASQGTMNNVLFGDDSFSYYETVCGGSGATLNADGADAVHTHMTNTRITDPEILEYRYPVRLERFCIRPNSGGEGKNRGGHGVIREMTFLKPLSLSIISQHRSEGPYGLNGGKAGAPGKQSIIRKDGTITELGAVDKCDIQTGDCLILQTPGGGGWGSGG